MRRLRSGFYLLRCKKTQTRYSVILRHTLARQIPSSLSVRWLPAATDSASSPCRLENSAAHQLPLRNQRFLKIPRGRSELVAFSATIAKRRNAEARVGRSGSFRRYSSIIARSLSRQRTPTVVECVTAPRFLVGKFFTGSQCSSPVLKRRPGSSEQSQVRGCAWSQSPAARAAARAANGQVGANFRSLGGARFSGRPMSQMGQTRSFGDVSGMSALPSIAAIARLWFRARNRHCFSSMTGKNDCLRVSVIGHEDDCHFRNSGPC